MDTRELKVITITTRRAMIMKIWLTKDKMKRKWVFNTFKVKTLNTQIRVIRMNWELQVQDLMDRSQESKLMDSRVATRIQEVELYQLLRVVLKEGMTLLSTKDNLKSISFCNHQLNKLTRWLWTKSILSIRLKMIDIQRTNTTSLQAKKKTVVNSQKQLMEVTFNQKCRYRLILVFQTTWFKIQKQ